MVPFVAVAALGTALCVALSNVIATPATRHLGPFAFNRWRLLAALVVLLVVATFRSGWSTLSSGDFLALGLSALLGIVAGDTAIYAAIARIGPRRTGLLYAMNAPISALLGFTLLGERLAPGAIAGAALVVLGIWLAIVYRDAATAGTWEAVHGSFYVGVALGLLGALGQAGAALIARPIMAAGTDPSAAACVRVVVALVALYALALLPRFRAAASPTRVVLGRAALAGALGMGAGMTLLLFALASGSVGVVTTLASTTPIMLLPLLWVASGQRPDWRAWIGAALAVAGVVLIVV